MNMAESKKTLAEVRKELNANTIPSSTSNTLSSIRQNLINNASQTAQDAAQSPTRYEENIAYGQREEAYKKAQALYKASRVEASKDFSKQLVRATVNKTTGMPSLTAPVKQEQKDTTYLTEINKTRKEMNLPLISTLPSDTEDAIKQQSDTIRTNQAYADIIKKVNFTAEPDALGAYNLPVAQEAKSPTQIVAEHMKSYETDPEYRNQMKLSIQKQIAADMVAKNEQYTTKNGLTPMRLINDIMSFEGNFIDGLTSGAYTSGLFDTISKPYTDLPDYKQTIEAYSNASHLSATIGNLAGSLASQIAIQGVALNALNAGLSLSRVSLSTKAVANLNKIAIGIGTQIPMSAFQRDSIQQLYDERGDIALEIVRNGFSWYVGGNLERAMDGVLGKLVMSEASKTGIRKLAYAALTKTPILYRATTEFAETIGQTLGSVALGQTEYLTDPAYMIQNVGMDMLMLTVSGLVGVDGTNKAKIAKSIREIRKNFDTAMQKTDASDAYIALAREETIGKVNELISKYDIKDQQMIQVTRLMNDLFAYNADNIQLQTMTLEQAGKFGDEAKTTNEQVAYEQTKELAKGQEPEVVATEFKDAMVKDPPIGIKNSEVENSEFQTVRVKESTMEFARQMRKTFGVDIIFGQYDSKKINNTFYGVYTASNNTILINSTLTEADAMEAVISHEIVHSMKQTAPAAYESLVYYIETEKLALDPEFQKAVEKAKMTTPKGEDVKVLEAAKEEYLGDLLMAMYKVDKNFIANAVKNDAGAIKALMTAINRSKAVQMNLKDTPILNAFKEINGLSKQMEAALYKFGKEHNFEVKPKADVVAETPAAKAETPVAKTEPVAAEPVAAEPVKEAKKPIVKKVKEEVVKPKSEPETKPKEEVIPKKEEEISPEQAKYAQQSKDIMQSAFTTMDYAESVNAGKTAQKIKDEIGEGAYDKFVKSSRAFEQTEMDYLDANPNKVQEESNRIIGILSSGKKIDSEGFAHAIALMKHYLKTDNVEGAENIFALYIPAMSEQGRSLQAGRLLASTTPLGYTKVVEAQITRLNEQGRKKYGKKWVDVKLTAKERASILNTNMNDVELRDYQLLLIGQRIASEMPHNVGDYINAWRKFSMLSSVRTHARNFLSNALYVPTQNLNNVIATALESGIKIGTTAETMPWSTTEAVRTMGAGFERLNKTAGLAIGNDWQEMTLTTKSLAAIKDTNPNNAKSVESLRKLLKDEITSQLDGKAKEFFQKNSIIDKTIDSWVETNKSIDTATRTHAAFAKKDAVLDAKISEDWKKTIKPTLGRLNPDTISTRNVFGVDVKPFGESKNRAVQFLNKAAKFNSWALNDLEDVPFYGIAYRMALRNYMKSNNQTEITAVAREYANNRALEATYKQNYAFIQAIDKLKRMRIAGDVVDVIMPFTRTPANIIMRGIENSPIGLAKGMVELGKYIMGNDVAFESNGKIKNRGDVALLRKGISDIASGLGGTAVVALGVMLFQMGLVTGPPEDEYKLANYRKQVGEAPFALHIGDTYIPLDWIQPTITPLITGLAMAKAFEESGFNGDGLMKAGTAGMNVVLELPFLSTLQDLLSTQASQSNDSNALWNAVGKFTSSYVSQMIPTLVGDVNRAFDNTQRSTYTPKSSAEEIDGLAQKLPYTIRQSVRNILSKIAPQLLEAKVDIWGRELKRSDNDVVNVMQSMLFPFLATSEKKKAVDKELIRLAGSTGSEQIYPKVSPKTVSVTFNGETTQYELDSKEYAGTWQKTCGTSSYKVLDGLITSSAYRSVDDALKSEAYSMATGYGKTKADKEFLVENGASGIVLNDTDDRIYKDIIEVYIANKSVDSGTTKIEYPRTSGDTVTVANRTYAFTQTQKNSFETLLTSETRTALSELISSPSYLNADAEKQYEKLQKVISDTRDKAARNYVMKNKSALTVKK